MQSLADLKLHDSLFKNKKTKKAEKRRFIPPFYIIESHKKNPYIKEMIKSSSYLKFGLNRGCAEKEKNPSIKKK